MGNLREYRRDEERIARTLLERKDITTMQEFEREYKDYMRGAQQDPNFKNNVLVAIKNKQGSKFKKGAGVKLKEVKERVFIFTGQQKGKSKIFRARFDAKVKRYRNEKGQFVKKI